MTEKENHSTTKPMTKSMVAKSFCSLNQLRDLTFQIIHVLYTYVGMEPAQVPNISTNVWVQ